MDDTALLATGINLLSCEARYIDERRWDDWLGLYLEDAVFWAPAWRDDDTLTEDVDREISLFYFESRGGLEDRVWRIRSGQSPALTPMPRTTHHVTNTVLDDGAEARDMTLHSAWSCHVYSLRDKSQHVFFGRYRHDLICVDNAWRIRRKKITLMNDYIPGMIDVFCV